MYLAGISNQKHLAYFNNNKLSFRKDLQSTLFLQALQYNEAEPPQIQRIPTYIQKLVMQSI